MARKSYTARQRDAIRQTLLDTVTQCILERGLIHSSLDELCRRVGISKSFFYTFFSSKEELVLQALRCQHPRLLDRARALMEDPALSWREGVRQFFLDCCGTQNDIAVLSPEEERAIRRCLTPENFQAFQQDQIRFAADLLAVFGVPAGAVDPRLFANAALSMIMVYKGIPDSMPFLFPEVSGQMLELQIHALTDTLERTRAMPVPLSK